MNKDCGRCHGKGGREIILKGRGFFGGQLKEWKKCDTCHGSGVNPDYRTKSCAGCWKTIEYRSKTPSEKVSTHCPDCRTRLRNEKERERLNRQNQPGQQQQPRHEQRPSYDDKWQEKPCPGLKGESGCGSRNTIRYRTDWSRIPDLCPDCIAKIKSRKVESEAKWKEKPCKRCSNPVKYSTDWDHPPEYCKKCTDLRVRITRDGNNFQAVTKTGATLFTFGRCRPARTYNRGEQESAEAKRQREWNEKGYWWVSLPGKIHETYIVTKEPVTGGFIEAEWDDVVAMKTSPGTMLRGFAGYHVRPYQRLRLRSVGTLTPPEKSGVFHI